MQVPDGMNEAVVSESYDSEFECILSLVQCVPCFFEPIRLNSVKTADFLSFLVSIMVKVTVEDSPNFEGIGKKCVDALLCTLHNNAHNLLFNFIKIVLMYFDAFCINRVK